ncbi:MAG: hypothetical protein IBJ00_01010 [Alphaproteobacteria bacterium]|nr:hypothetical protein [Alphaproteobacteria bacterium]
MNKLFYFSSIFLSAFIFANSIGFSCDDEKGEDDRITVSISERLFSDLNQKLDDIGQGIQDIRLRTPHTHTYQQEANALLSTDLKNFVLALCYISVSYLAWQTDHFEPTTDKRFYGNMLVPTYIKDEDMGIFDKHTTFPSSLTIPLTTAGLYHFFQLSPVKTFIVRPIKSLISSSFQSFCNVGNTIAIRWYRLFGTAGNKED